MPSFLDALPDGHSVLPCKTNPHVFVTDHKGHPPRRTTDTAKALCDACPVRPQCLDYALTAGEMDGVWGGLSAAERRQLLRTRAITRGETR